LRYRAKWNQMDSILSLAVMIVDDDDVDDDGNNNTVKLLIEDGSQVLFRRNKKYR